MKIFHKSPKLNAAANGCGKYAHVTRAAGLVRIHEQRVCDHKGKDRGASPRRHGAKAMTKNSINFNVPLFRAYEAPNGFFTDEIACHALWYYYLCARNAFETHVADVVVFEGDPDPQMDLKQLMMSIATAYGVQPEVMVKFWRNVDMQCATLGLPKMPAGEKYRFDTVVEVKTQ